MYLYYIIQLFYNKLIFKLKIDSKTCTFKTLEKILKICKKNVTTLKTEQPEFKMFNTLTTCLFFSSYLNTKSSAVDLQEHRVRHRPGHQGGVGWAQRSREVHPAQADHRRPDSHRRYDQEAQPPQDRQVPSGELYLEF